jgi:hypothetical protein
MAMFITRVELHRATAPGDYTRLHAQMRAQGFAMTIVASDGVSYHLPPAEYCFIGQATLVQVRDMAQRAAAQVDNSHAVLVTESNGSAWVGLQPVR